MAVTKVAERAAAARAARKKPKKKPSMDQITTDRKSSINRKRSVSATDIREATTANELAAVQRRINAIQKAMQKMLDAQVMKFEAKQAADVDKAGRKAAQAQRDKKPFKGYTPTSPFNKGGYAKKYNKGGYANCGASVPGTQGKK